MDLIDILVRIVHVAASLVWIGFGLFEVTILKPAMRSTVFDGSRVWGSILNNTYLPLIFMVTPILSLITGLWLLYDVSDGFYDEYMGSTRGIILSTGVLAGIAAVGHGGATLGRATTQMKQLTAKTLNNDTLNEAELKQYQDLEAYRGKHAWISLAMMTIALFTMVMNPYIA